MTAAGVLLALALAFGGVALLRRAWARGGGGVSILTGWAALACGAIGWKLAGCAVDLAVALAILAPSLVVIPFLAAAVLRAERGRAGRGRRVVPEVEPPAASGPAWRAWAQVACVGPLGGAAAMGLAALMALRAPWPAADRLVAAAFLAPLAWAVAAVWATTDGRLARVATALAAVAGLSFAAAAL